MHVLHSLHARKMVWPRRAVVYNRDDSMPGTQTLNRRLAKLESLAALSQVEPVFSDEDRAIMQRIIDGWYADPERNADHIALIEQAKSPCAILRG